MWPAPSNNSNMGSTGTGTTVQPPNSASASAPPSQLAAIASPALRGTIVLAQCRSWLLAEEESRCRTLLNGINHEKHSIKTSLNSKSESMQKEGNTLKAQLTKLREREDTLRKELDASSTIYLKLFRDPTVSRGNDEMLREKQRGNELWNELELIIHERNSVNAVYTKLETTNLCIIQNLYQTQVLLQTQQEKQRQHGLYGMDMEDDELDAEPGVKKSNSISTSRTSNAPQPLPLHSPSNLSSTASSAPVDIGPQISPSLSTSSSFEVLPVSPIDKEVLDEVTKLNQLRNTEISLQKKLSKFLGLREQVQSYLIKIAGFQKKLWQQQFQQQQRDQTQFSKLLKSQPSSGRASPAPSSPRSHTLLKSSNPSNSQPIPISSSGHRRNGSGNSHVFDPNQLSPSPGESMSPSTPQAQATTPHQLLKSSSTAARSISPTGSVSNSPVSVSSSPASPVTQRNNSGSSRANTSATTSPSAASSLLVNKSNRFTPSTAAALPYNAERDRVEKTQLANLVFDARNRKVLARICEQFQRSGLISSRRYKKSPLLIHNAFLGVEMLTWVLNIGISANRNDALILLELLLRAGLIDMIQESDSQSEPVDVGVSTLRIDSHSQFGDMKLQFALYRLRGDSSEIGKLSKSGWLHKVSRWRVHRRYVSWDADLHRLALFNSNKDEHPSRVYYLGAATIITTVDAQERGGNSAAALAALGSQSAAAILASQATVPIDSVASSKYYFQLHFSPPQNEESSLLLYASSAQERAEWLKILWLSGCEYPSLGSARSILDGSNMRKEEVAPGSRPAPIHPSLLASSLAITPAASGGPLISQQASNHPNSALGDSDSDSELDDDYYEDASLTGTTENSEAADSEDIASERGDRVSLSDPPRRYAADDFDSAGHSRANSMSSATSSANNSRRSSLLSSATFSGAIGSGRRRFSLAERKHESDLMGVFSLRRAKNKFASQAAFAKVHEVRRKNLEKRVAMLRDRALMQPHATSKPSSDATIPSADGLELGWRDYFVSSADIDSKSDLIEAARTASIVSSQQQAAEENKRKDEEKATTSPAKKAFDEDDVKQETEAGDIEADGAIAPHSSLNGSLSANNEVQSAADKDDDQDQDVDGDGDDDDDDYSDYNSEDEAEEGSLADFNLQELLTPIPTPSAASAHPTAEELESMRLHIRKQRFHAISLSLHNILFPAAGLLTASPSANASAAASTAVHPLTTFLASFARQFHDLYSHALDMETLGGSTQRQSIAASQSAAAQIGWPLVARTVSGSSASGSTPRERAATTNSSPTATSPSNTDGVVNISASPSTPNSAGLSRSASPAAVSGAQANLYPYPRHARAVLQAAKEDVRAFLASIGSLLSESLRACEEELRVEIESDFNEREKADDAEAARNAATAGLMSPKKLKEIARARAKARRNDPALRRLEREFILLGRLCTQLVSHHTFLLVGKPLFQLYEIAHRKKNLILLDAIQANEGVGFQQMGLSEDLIIVARSSTTESSAASNSGAGTAISYQHAIDTFRDLPSLQSPIDKLQCVVSVAKAICDCVDQAKLALNNEAKGESTSTVSPVVIGADDLLLLFTYVLIHSGVPALMAELAFLSDFIPEYQRCTIQGYYLATTQAAAELLCSEEFAHTIAARENQQTQVKSVQQPQPTESPSAEAAEFTKESEEQSPVSSD